jgi:hypothetical protein
MTGQTVFRKKGKPPSHHIEEIRVAKTLEARHLHLGGGRNGAYRTTNVYGHTEATSEEPRVRAHVDLPMGPRVLAFIKENPRLWGLYGAEPQVLIFMNVDVVGSELELTPWMLLAKSPKDFASHLELLKLVLEENGADKIHPDVVTIVRSGKPLRIPLLEYSRA